MKKVILIIILVFSTVISKAQSSEADEKETIATLNTFYTAYMSAFTTHYEDMHAFENVLQKLRKKYCTASCIQQYHKLVEESDADPIIKGQDSDEKWAKTLSVKRNVKKPNQYSVTYYNDEYGKDGKLHKMTTIINLNIKKENGNIKIDSFL